MSQRLERAVNIGIIVAAAAFVGTQVKLWLHSHEPRTARPAAYSAGDVVPVLAGMSSTRQALVVFVSKNCSYCTESMPFYGGLSKRLAGSDSTSFIAISRQTVDVTRAYLGSHDVAVAKIASLGTEEAPRLRLTPTMMLVDRSGRILQVWTGKLSAAGEAEVLQRVVGSD